MKKMISALLAAALLLAALPACQWIDQLQGRLQQPEPQIAASEAVSVLMLASGYTGQTGNLEYMNAGGHGDELLAAYLEMAYGLPDGAWEDAAIIRAVGASAFELTALHLESEDGAAQTAALLETYLAGRRGDFVGYAPEQAEMIEGAGIAREGSYVALCICPDPDQATENFRLLIRGSYPAGSELLEILPSAAVPSEWPPQGGPSTPEPRETQSAASYPGRCDFIQPNIDDMSLYDTSAILAAWEKGDPASLSGCDMEIYYAARDVLASVLRDGMSDLEKESAVYHWVVVNVNYDWTHQDVMAETPRESFTPYGALVDRTAVCLGYATAFQLLMDMAGVECITVVGASSDSQEDHGWNMVRLNGNWYCVDVTWDANYREYGLSRGRESDWRYFNITSGEMAATDHQWDYASIPEAVTRGKGHG